MIRDARESAARLGCESRVGVERRSMCQGVMKLACSFPDRSTTAGKASRHGLGLRLLTAPGEATRPLHGSCPTYAIWDGIAYRGRGVSLECAIPLERPAQGGRRDSQIHCHSTVVFANGRNEFNLLHIWRHALAEGACWLRRGPTTCSTFLTRRSRIRRPSRFASPASAQSGAEALGRRS
jgi:hypothetical protein